MTTKSQSPGHLAWWRYARDHRIDERDATVQRNHMRTYMLLACLQDYPERIMSTLIDGRVR